MPKSQTASFDPKVFLATAGAGKKILALARGSNAYAQGDVADSVFYIQKGRVKLVVASDKGKEAVVGILEPGQFFGEGCLSGHATRAGTVTALGDCVVTAIKKEVVIETLRQQPGFVDFFVAFLLSRNDRIEEDLIDQLFNSSERRLARQLLLLANFGKEGGPEPIDLKINQETLAEMIGTTRSRVSRFMNKFRKLGFIEYNGSIHVHKSLLHAVLRDKLHGEGRV